MTANPAWEQKWPSHCQTSEMGGVGIRGDNWLFVRAPVTQIKSPPRAQRGPRQRLDSTSGKRPNRFNWTFFWGGEGDRFFSLFWVPWYCHLCVCQQVAASLQPCSHAAQTQTVETSQSVCSTNSSNFKCCYFGRWKGVLWRIKSGFLVDVVYPTSGLQIPF